jgi:UDP-N-acetylglucosamine 2-epimerase (non-hydrolysing)
LKKILVVFGTRPEAIKMATLCHSLKNEKKIDTVICSTGQHKEMLNQVFNLFDFYPDIDLNLMESGQDLYDITSKVLIKMRDILKLEKPDLVLVHGDTSTTFAASLACFFMGIEVGHIEAGLRTGDMTAPFPEEFNRQSSGLIASYHFAPTELSKKNLLNEGKLSKNIIVTGNTVIDALHFILNKIHEDKHQQNELELFFKNLFSFDISKSKFVLITGHRRENFGQGFLDICEAIKRSALANPNIHFIYPVHLNPNVQRPVNDILDGLDNVWLINPLEYEKFVYLLEKSYLVLTDSGGIQEEAPSLGKPVLVMREVTERPEAVNAGTVRLVGSSVTGITDSINSLLIDNELYKKMSFAHNPYGDGNATDKIIKFIKEILNV